MELSMAKPTMPGSGGGGVGHALLFFNDSSPACLNVDFLHAFFDPNYSTILYLVPFHEHW